MKQTAQNVIAFAEEWANEARAAGLDFKQVSAHVQERAASEHPVYLGMLKAVVYNDKTDRYVVKFGDSSAKATNAVAEFLLTEVFRSTRTARPTVFAHMTDGTIDAALLLFLSRS